MKDNAIAFAPVKHSLQEAPMGGKEDFLLEHQEGTVYALDLIFQSDEELMEIFKTMNKDQIYAVSLLMSNCFSPLQKRTLASA